MPALVLALGQRFAGDDAVGPAIAERLRGAPGLTVIEAADTTDLVDALQTGEDVILIDAVRAAGAPGTVRLLAPEDLGRDAVASVSSHGLDVAGAIALARALGTGASPPRVRIVGVVIAAADPFREGLSPAVAAAVERAAEVVLELASSTLAMELPAVITE